ncbi:MAG: cytidyltransferase, partial [Bacteroidia bacterium]|nr:cytidyltransferase [Bacteroidia bacterium]
RINVAGARALAEAANGLWKSIADRDLTSFGNYFRASFEAQIAMFPHMVTPKITERSKSYETSIG